jgi:Bacterial Ig domain/PKD domain/Carboxypeptidase regulatory-like domain
VVFTGAQAGNLPPVATLAASKLQANVGEVINFTATASDPTGDSLAYYWEYSDNLENYSIDNSPVQSKSFSAAGEYTVRCVVSDMRGGRAHRTLIVRVGNPATFRISGHVLDDKNRPLAGIQVSASASRIAYTDSDGSYTIVNLAAGSYSLSALETVSGAVSFVKPYFSNPITVGPNFSTADFIGVSGSLVLYSPLAAKNSSGWRYHDKGVDLGNAWLQPAYDDSAWSNGVAPLGYPSGTPITTLISFGADANNKYPTYYFRKNFNVANPAAYTNLLLELLRDDGAAVYLNGTEVLRDNLAGGATYSTFATDNSAASGYSQTTLPVSAIIAGTNTLAVEVHQANATSSDVVMDAALSGLSASNVTGLNIAYLSSPADNQAFSSPTNITLSAEVFTAGAVTLVEFYVNGAKIGDASVAPFTAVLNNPSNGSHLLRAVATVNSLLLTSPPVTIVVAAPVTPLASATLVAAGSTWRYFDKGQDLGSAWRAPAFNDSGWSNGAAKLGFGGTAVTTLVNGGPSNARFPTTYFRHAFVVPDPAGLTNLTLSLLRDDGAVVYLNGVEVVRDNIQNGIAVAYSTLATNTADNGTLFFSYSLPISALVPGSNSVAVEVHQSSVTSSDLALDLSLTAQVVTNRSRGCWLVSPAGGTVVPLPGSVTLNAEAVAGGLLGVGKVEFFSGGQKVGEDTTFPYSFAWANPPSGSLSLTAVATDSDGATITSDAVNITVLSPPLGTAFISFGDMWKYQDDGSNQGTNWAARLFDDRLWMAGPARLGYGGDGEITTVSFGTNANVKYITTYFRKAFTVANPTTYSGLLLRLIRDDGAAVYLNGREIYRSNLQPGPLSWNSLALTAADGANETAVFDATLPTTGLLAGTNILALELHQNSVNSSDLGFGLALLGLDDTNTATGIYLTAPASGARYNSPATVSLSSFAAAPSPVTLVEYFANGAKVGQSTAQPYNASWSGPAAGSYSLTAVATYGDGIQMTSAPVMIVVGAPPAPITPIFQTLVLPSTGWKYWDSASAVGPGWEKTSFDDAAWPSANARFGWGLDGEMTVLNSGRITHYFRRWFNVTNLGVLSDLFFYLQRDDGAVVYLNGIELFRTNMPTGPISASTLASTGINTPDETIWLEREMPAAGSGLGSSNLIAVELHQSSASSSDGSFDFAVYALGTSDRRIYLASPAGNASYSSTASVLIEAGASAGAGLGVNKVEFFANGMKIGESAAAPFKMNWSGAAFGPHILMARMFDSLGATQDSAPVTINVTRELFTATLIPAGSVWKYLDTGSTTQGTNWSQPGFNDLSWPMGQARLGFSPGGVDGEVTTLAGQPTITYYFRKTFVTTPGLVYTNLNFRLVRDDGAVVWLNGREAYRSNMPAGTIAYNTRPSASVGNADEQTFFSTVITITNLPAGTNIVGVEVHQFDGTSSDLGFNLELIASGYVENITPPLLAIVLEDGMTEISWPSTYSGYQVYTATAVNAPAGSWTPVGVTPVLASGRYVVTISPSGGAEFFRLIKP